MATKAAVQVLGHVLKIPVFLHLGFDYSAFALPIVTMSFVALFGSKIGIELLKRMSTDLFRWLFKAALFIAALRLLYKILEL